MKYKLNKSYKIGYFFMAIGLSLNIFNYIMLYDAEHVFGNFVLYIFSGMLFALGITFVFKEKPKEDGIKNEKN